MPLKTAQPEYVQPKYVVSTQHNQFTAGLSRFGPAGTPSRACLFTGGQPLDERCPAQSDSRQSQNTTTRPLVKPTRIVLN